MSTVHLKKARAGSDSQGHVWPEDGAVVEVDYDHALVLLAIPDGGFSVVDNPQPAADGPREPKAPETGPESEPGDSSEEVSEVAPEPEPDATPDEKPAPRRGRPRKTVEEG